MDGIMMINYATYKQINIGKSKNNKVKSEIINKDYIIKEIKIKRKIYWLLIRM
jgi:hypothetical protein